MASSYGAADYSYRDGTLTMPYTFACWGKVASVSSSRALMGAMAAGSSMASQFFYIRSDGRLCAQTVNTAGGYGEAVSTAATPTGVWFHGAAVFSATNARRIYLNGANTALETSNHGTGTLDRFMLGAQRYNANQGNFFNGLLMDCAMWNAALNADEIASLARGTRPDQIRPQSLFSWRPFDGRNNDVVLGTGSMSYVGTTTSSDAPTLR